MRILEIFAAGAIIISLWWVTTGIIWTITNSPLYRAITLLTIGAITLAVRIAIIYMERAQLEERFGTIIFHTLSFYGILVSIFGILVFQEEYTSTVSRLIVIGLGTILSVVFLFILVRERLNLAFEKECFYCGKLVRRMYLICPYCVFPIQSICPKCKTHIQRDFDFCSNCGNDTPWKNLSGETRSDMNNYCYKCGGHFDIGTQLCSICGNMS
ncbi:MAG: hypothetical protein HeimC3_15690 [Candidatus Heimdallarchaeota archaeon LC_3]|nr:MAG: hypothetical protein HeimC3_15690 [Candidatus Heimdallarchaeota archaeon LC_3]